jgi:adenylate cyclase, class 2
VVEHEMKIPIGSHAAVRRRLARRRAQLIQTKTPEDNWVLDDRAGTLAASGRLLRLRRFAGRTILTFKGTASFAAGVKSRPEYETAMEDAGAALAILAGLGLVPVRRYQKLREVWSLGGVTVALDETPMGAFVELEGETAGLPAAAAALGLDPGAAARGTYLDLWAAFRAEHPEAPEDMVFPDSRGAVPPDTMCP